MAYHFCPNIYTKGVDVVPMVSFSCHLAYLFLIKTNLKSSQTKKLLFVLFVNVSVDILILILLFTKPKYLTFTVFISVGFALIGIFIFRIHRCKNSTFFSENKYKDFYFMFTFLVALSSGVLALYFFGEKSSDTILKIEDSSEYNKLCFHSTNLDNHDLWHLFSGVFILYTFVIAVNVSA